MSALRLLCFALLVLAAGCNRTPCSSTLAGEWCQDSDYFQSKGLINQLAELDRFEDFELYFSDGRVAATRLVGKEPDEKRVYWEVPYSFSRTPDGEYQLAFADFDERPITAAVQFEGQRLVLQDGDRKIGLIRGEALNLRVKKYVPKK